MSWVDFVYEFNKNFFNPTMLSAQQTEFLNFKQDNMTVAEAVKKFEWLSLLSPHWGATNKEDVRNVSIDIALAIESGGDQLPLL